MKDPFDLEHGHAPDVALSALADGQEDIVPRLVIAHVDSCERCSSRMGDLAHQAVRADQYLHDARPVQDIAPETAAMDAARVPWRLVAAGLFVAFLGSAFDFSASGGDKIQAVVSFFHNAPLFVRSLVSSFTHVAHEREGAIALVAMTASLALCAVTFVVARNRFIPEKSSS
jgi:hypothetical protein